jgi:hypothetical protein
MKANKITRINTVTQTNPTPTRAFGGPHTAGVEYDDGIDALVIATDNPPTAANRVVLPATATVEATVQGTAAATAGNYPASFFIAPYPIEIVSVRERHEVLGTDAGAVTLMLKKVPSGTAVGSGTDTLSAGINLKATINTNQSGALHGTAANLRLAAGDSLGLVTTGVLTAVAGVSVTVEYKRRDV